MTDIKVVRRTLFSLAASRPNSIGFPWKSNVLSAGHLTCRDDSIDQISPGRANLTGTSRVIETCTAYYIIHATFAFNEIFCPLSVDLNENRIDKDFLV